MDNLPETNEMTEDTEISETAAEIPESDDSPAGGSPEMSKPKSLLIKCLPLIIVLACTGIFMFAIKTVIGVFYSPEDLVFSKEYGGESFTIVQCKQSSSSRFYIYTGGFAYDKAEYENAAGEHDRAHFAHIPEVYFILNEEAPDVDSMTFKLLNKASGVVIYQFGEFVLYRLEGQYGVIAPLRENGQSTVSREKDLYIVRRLIKDDVYKDFEPVTGLSHEEFLRQLESLELYLSEEGDK